MSVVGLNLLAGGSQLSTHLSSLAVGDLLVVAGDPRSTRIVYAMVIGLALIGVLFVFLAVWVIRQTRVDLEMLAPLERMGDREWRKSDPASQRRSLDELRPPGAEPLQKEPHRPRVDSEFEQSDRPVQSFDDLSAVVPESSDRTPLGIPSGDPDAGEGEVEVEQTAPDADADDSEDGAVQLVDESEESDAGAVQRVDELDEPDAEVAQLVDEAEDADELHADVVEPADEPEEPDAEVAQPRSRWRRRLSTARGSVGLGRGND